MGGAKLIPCYLRPGSEAVVLVTSRFSVPGMFVLLGNNATTLKTFCLEFRCLQVSILSVDH